MWEQRSRSQSKGRSKSRGRDLGAGSRISVVPEVPELLAALAQLEAKHKESLDEPAKTKMSIMQEYQHSSSPETEENTKIPGGDEAQKEGPNDDEDEEPETPAHLNPAFAEGSELASDPWGAGEYKSIESSLPLEDDDEIPETEARLEPSIFDHLPATDQSPEAAYAASGNQDDVAAQSPPSGERTPTRISPRELPTPSTTPQPTELKPRVSAVDGGGNDKLAEDVEPGGYKSSALPRTPTTPVQAATVPEPPLTPEATPARPKGSHSSVLMTFGGDLASMTSHGELHVAPTKGAAESPLAEPTYRHIPPTVDKDWEEDTAGDNFHLPTGLLSEAAAERTTQGIAVNGDVDTSAKVKWPSQRDAVRPPPKQVLPEEETDSRYHNVWKIQDYEPEFAKPAAIDIETRRLAKVDFTGNPLKELPKSQLSAAAEPFKPVAIEAPNPYPYSTNDRNGPGDFAVHVPPSPTTTYVPGEHRARQPRHRSRSRQGPRENRERYTSRNAPGKNEWDAPPVIERALHAASVSVIQGLTVPVELYRGLRDSYYPPPGRPDIVKAYPIRRRLPVRIFFPTHHDLTSPALLPTLFTIHGGGFTVGSAADDDAWNRSFSDAYTVLVIALNYSKAPWAVFPTPLLDAEALYHAVLSDESLPLDRMRTAICGFDAGGNLALGLAQLPSVKTGYDPARHPHHDREYNSQPYPPAHAPPRSHPPPAGVISVCGILDFAMPAARKARTRPYKRALRGPRGWGPGLDWMAKLLPSSAWSYIPYGHDISDPLLSPAYASRADLPPHVFVVGAELDCLAHESWRTACAWAGRAVPDVEVLVGRRGPSRWRGSLDDGRGENAAKFAWEEAHSKGGNGSAGVEGTTRWLLVPDVVHGFDSAQWRNKYLWGDEESRMDSEMKTIAYQRELAEWLWGTVWR